MIDAKELRIGNLISVAVGKFAGTIIQVLAEDIPIIKDNPDNHNPIPITEDFLIKNDFPKEGTELYIIGYMELFYEGGALIPDEYYTAAPFNPDVKILYIHQLQNLYHALTGKELELK